MISSHSPQQPKGGPLLLGGVKGSSIGQREQGKAAQEFYTEVHAVTVAPGAGSPCAEDR